MLFFFFLFGAVSFLGLVCFTRDASCITSQLTVASFKYKHLFVFFSSRRIRNFTLKTGFFGKRRVAYWQKMRNWDRDLGWTPSTQKRRWGCNADFRGEAGWVVISNLLSGVTLIHHLSILFVTGSGFVVHWERCRFGDRVFWVRSTQATCASAAGAGPAVPKSEDFSMDTDSSDSTDNEVSLW